MKTPWVWRSVSAAVCFPALVMTGCADEASLGDERGVATDFATESGGGTRPTRARGGTTSTPQEPGPHDAGADATASVTLASDAGSLMGMLDATVLSQPPQPDGGAPTSDCDLEGLFALRIEAAVHWEGTSLFDIVPIITPGQGSVRVDTLVRVVREGAGYRTTVQGCGAQVPDFSASIGETYGARFADDTWEQIDQRWSTAATTSCNRPGCAFDTEFIMAQLGIGISERASWPGTRDPLDAKTLRDDDKDGVVGVTLQARGPSDGPAYRHPPTSYLLLERVEQLMLAIRVGAELTGTLRSCDRIDGTSKTMVLDTRALACRTDSGTLCDQGALDFVDDNLPIWKVTQGTWQSVRVPADASCAVARSMP